jgi:cytochrome P450
MVLLRSDRIVDSSKHDKETTMASSTVTASAELPLAPQNPLPILRQVTALRTFHTGLETLRDAGGPVTRLVLAPKWLAPTVVIATSPRGAHDVLGRGGQYVDKTIIHQEMRHLLGPNLFDLNYEQWLPRRRALQPVFTKQNVRAFGGHIAQAAETVAGSWADGTQVDLDVECRKLTLRALGRSVLGLDLNDRSEAVADPLRVAVEYVTNRAMRPVRAPRWLPTPARARARGASEMLHRLADDILQACRTDPGRDAPLVRALMAATDPDSGQGLSDEQIRSELVIFMLAGHDTTATTLAYALWALGLNLDVQQRVADEAAAIGNRELTPEDISRLGYTVQVLHEALRLCPPGAATARMAQQDIEVDGYRVQAGSMLMVGIYALHRDPALWDNPLVFDPDRFSPEQVKGRDRWHYLPFGAGPRSCIGDHFAMLEATLALGTIVRSHEIRSIDADFPMIVPFTTVAATPIHAQIRSRRSPKDQQG